MRVPRHIYLGPPGAPGAALPAAPPAPNGTVHAGTELGWHDGPGMGRWKTYIAPSILGAIILFGGLLWLHHEPLPPVQAPPIVITVPAPPAQSPVAQFPSTIKVEVNPSPTTATEPSQDPAAEMSAAERARRFEERLRRGQ